MQFEEVRSFVQEVVTVAKKHELPAEVTATLKAWLDGHEFTSSELSAAADSIFLYDAADYVTAYVTDAAIHTLYGLSILAHDNNMDGAESSFDTAERALSYANDPASDFNAPWGRDHY